MLLEWFQKRQQPRPKIDYEMAGRRYRATVTVHGGLVYEMPADEAFSKKDEAEQAAATMALLQLFPDQPLYRLLPPAYRELWHKWEKDAKAPEQQEAAAALVARDKFITSLCERPRDATEPPPKRRAKPAAGMAPSEGSGTADMAAAEGGGTGAGSAAGAGGGPSAAPVDEAAAARARQMAADAEDDREAAEEEERERLAAEAELTHARGLQLQVAYERWRASEEGIAHAKFRATLPISQLEAQVRVAMEDGQVAVVCGETGSGKSTQVPQMLLEHALESGRGGVTSVICTQPRRIAATSLARRVAQERGEQAGARGAMVGYQVRLESKRTESTKLLFCTTGIALRMMLSDPPLQGVSHVVVDEVHERDTQTDQLLLLLRELMPTRPDLKVVLMSATVQAELFSRYFDGAAILTSKGRTFPVDEHYLEHALKLTGHVLPTDSPCWLRNAGEWHKHSFAVHNRAITQEWQETGGSVNPEYSDARYAEYGEGVCNVLRSLNEHVINYDLIFDLLGYIDDTYEEGAVLVFLPGLSDITTVLGLCQADRRLGDTRRFCVLPLHSSLSPAEQSAVFETMPPGVRKVRVRLVRARAANAPCGLEPLPGTFLEPSWNPFLPEPIGICA
jgi:energy-coupling factor transporter ATP-binding protein EcfA2